MDNRQCHLKPRHHGLWGAIFVSYMVLASASHAQMRDAPTPDAVAATTVAALAIPAVAANDMPEKKSGTVWKGCLAGVVAGLIVPGLGNLIGLVLGCGAGYATS